MTSSLTRRYSFLKFLDQPQLLHRLNKPMYTLLPVMGAGVVAYSTLTAKPEERKNTFIRQSLIALGTVLSAAAASRFFIHKPSELRESMKEALEGVEGFLKTLPKSETGLRALVSKMKTNVLSPREVHSLRERLLVYAKGDKKAASELLEKLIETPEGHTGIEMLKEIGELSLMGLVPVLGGLFGGMAGNYVTKQNWREKSHNQVKEAIFQYLANIVLCNVGAAMALVGLGAVSKEMVKRRAPRLTAMVVGILSVGVIGGSAIANFFANNFFNTWVDKDAKTAWRQLREKVNTHGVKSLFKGLYQERIPTWQDAILHIDDFVVAGQLAGLRPIGRLLPFLYSISAFRSGQGYRNGKTVHHQAHHPHAAALLNQSTMTPPGNTLVAAQTMQSMQAIKQPVFSERRTSFQGQEPILPYSLLQPKNAAASSSSLMMAGSTHTWQA